MPLARRLLVAGLIALPLALALRPALARDLTVALDPLPGQAAVGVPLKVGFTILSEPDGAPQAGLTPLVVARRATGGSPVMVMARPERSGGHYVATLILPAAGTWQWHIHPAGSADTGGIALDPLRVRNPAAESERPVTALLAALLTALGVAVWRAVVGKG